MNTNLTPHHIKRLSFIKFLFHSAQEQAKRPEPMCFSAILNLHDSIELFLVLGCILLNVGNLKTMGFMKYFEALKKKEGLDDLTQKQSLQKLNSIRRELKHRGLLPNRMELEEQLVSCKLFFKENTVKIFGIEFDKISLVDFVDNDEVKEHLYIAQEHRQEKNYEEAINEIAKAFYQLVNDFRNSMKNEHGHSYLALNSNNKPSYSSIRSYSRDLRDENSKLAQRLFQEFGKLEKYLDDLERHIELIGIGIDLKKLGRFKLSMPEVYRDGNSDLQIMRYTTRPLIEPSEDDIDFCFNFVIETSLHFSEFSYEIENSYKEFVRRIREEHGPDS